MTSFHPSVVEAVRLLAGRGAPFLTLGQTVLWDEPVKAAFCRALEAVAPDAPMVAGVHDTDYFAKLPGVENQDEPFVLLPHNDGSTRGLWSAAGEISCLFGSETVPTRALLADNGVAVDRVAKNYEGGAEALLDGETDAWGWRALVHTRPGAMIAADVKLDEVAPALRAQLEWALGESLRFLDAGDDNRRIAEQLRAWVEEGIAACEGGTLSDLYRFLTPRLWSLARGEGSCNLQATASLELFRFNGETASRPRFALVDLFLRPETRDIARRCYDEAVRGSGIYTLDQFGPGAVPFDVVVPGRGRGTLRLHEGSVVIQTETPEIICDGCEPQNAAELAALLERTFGPNVVLVGKAVALISMLSREFIFVFHEKASSYTSLTQKMNGCLRQSGLSLDLHPMLRLQHATWDALENVDATFQLPPHLATAFGSERVTASEFASRWENVCAEQDQLRAELKRRQAPRELLQLLAEWRGEPWIGLLEDYAAARRVVRATRDEARTLTRDAEALRASARASIEAAAQREREKGDDFRARVQPLREKLFDLKEAAANRLTALGPDGKPVKPSKAEREEQAEQDAREEQEANELRTRIEALQSERRETFDATIAGLRQEAREAKAQAKELIARRVSGECSEATQAARATTRRIEAEAELARLRFVRDALFVSQGLRHTNLRPTAWWFPLVSPDGRWFDALAGRVRARVEEL